jgi:hypothetical protein
MRGLFGVMAGILPILVYIAATYIPVARSYLIVWGHFQTALHG